MPQLKMEQARLWNEDYRNGNPQVSDEQFDFLLDQIESEMSAESFHVFRTSLMEKGGSIKHDFIIGSLRKCTYGEGQLSKWMSDYSITRKLFASLKLDGMSYTAKYADGVLVQVATRGDGQTGEDITASARFVLPNMLPITGLLEIRGEFVIPRKACAGLGYKNARNGVVGLMKTLEDIDFNKISNVCGPVYQILGSPLTIQEQYVELEKLGFETPEWGIFIADTHAEMEETLKEHLVERKENADYLVDGLVIFAPGTTAENAALPKQQVAFKVNVDFIQSTVVDMALETSKDGALKGVCVIDPIEIGGTTVTNCSIYNFDNVEKLGIGPGAVVMVTKGGDIIPKIVEVVKSADIQLEKYWSNCPSCGHPTGKKGVDIVCLNDVEFCEAQQVKAVTHFTRNLNILGASEISLDKWGIASIEDCLDFGPTDRNGEKFKLNFDEKVFNTSPEQLFGAMNWAGVGKSIFRNIFEVVSLQHLCDKAGASDSLGYAVEGVGDLTWDKIVWFFKQNKETLDRIVNDPRYNYKAPAANAAPATLDGKSFCCTGTLTRKRPEIEADIVAAGGVIKSVSKKLDFLVLGPGAGAKEDKANKLGVPIITEDQLMEMLKG